MIIRSSTHLCTCLLEFVHFSKNVAIELGIPLIVLSHLLLQQLVLKFHISGATIKEIIASQLVTVHDTFTSYTAFYVALYNYSDSRDAHIDERAK